MARTRSAASSIRPSLAGLAVLGEDGVDLADRLPAI